MLLPRRKVARKVNKEVERKIKKTRPRRNRS